MGRREARDQVEGSLSALRKLLELGPATQPVVAGLYAWAVTVAPAYGRHGPLGTQNWPASLAATLALLVLVYGLAMETVRAERPELRQQSRTFTLAVFCAASVVTWFADQDALAPARMSAARGVAGMVGWGLFAYACAAPVVEAPDSLHPVRIEAGPQARGRVASGDAFFVLGAALLAFLLQLVGWTVEVPERAMLVRVVALTGGVVLLGLAGSFVAMRHGSSPLAAAAPKGRVRVVSRPPLPFGWLIALLLLLAAGILYDLTS